MRRLTSIGVAVTLVLLASAVLPAAVSAARFAAGNAPSVALDALVDKEGEAIRFIATNTDVPEVHEDARLEGTQPPGTNQIFTADEGFGGIICITATLAGTSATGTDTEISLAPTYAGCKDSFGRTVHISVNGCTYELHPAAGSGSTYTGDWDIACEAGKAIEWKVTSGGSVVCTVTAGTQEGIGPIHFQNTTSETGTDLVVGFKATNLKSTTSGGFFNCGISNGAHSNGTYQGSSTITAEGTGIPQSFEHAAFSGEQVGNFLFSAGKGFGAITCMTSTFAGTSATGTETEISLVPTYDYCKDIYARTVHVATNGCTYELHPTAGSGATYTGDWDIACPVGKTMEMKVTSGGSVICTVTIGTQEDIDPIHFENMPGKGESPTDLTIGFEATNLKTTTSGGLSCGISNGVHYGGTYMGNTTITAENTESQPLDAAVVP